MRRKMMSIAMAAGLFLAALPNTKAFADDTSANISIGKAVSNLKIFGDMRLRQENFWKASRTQLDRSRQRFRLRLGIQPQLQDITIGFRMASGTGEQVSTNQSFDNLSGQKGLWIDQAYVQWKAREWLKLTGGKMENPLWRLYSSDLVWDNDFNPEGFAQQMEYQVAERFTPFLNAMQMVLDEDSTDNRDQWQFATQLGVKVKLFEETKWNVAATWIDNQYENINDFGQTTTGVTNEGNTRSIASASAISTGTQFTQLHITNELATRVGPWPVSLQLDYNINTDDFTATDERMGFQTGFILNKAKNQGSWEAAYFYKYSETDNTIADIADSDWGDGGTNRKGHIGWLAYALRDYMTISAKLFVTEVLNPTRAPGINVGTATNPNFVGDNINRFQLDLVVKF